jgi:ABC-2 type transport system ATP-binding protein
LPPEEFVVNKTAPPNGHPILEVRHLVKKYGAFKAVDDISFSIAEGICFGLLGPNGAGKTTSMEVMEGILKPTSGEITYRGRRRDISFKEEIGIQFQQTALLAFLSVAETIKTFQSLYRTSCDLNALLRKCHLEALQKQPNDKLSGGQRQRLLLAIALINDPRLLFLDEPSTGLDPQARRNLWDLVENVKGEGKTIILTTHYMEEAQELCDEIAIMDQGRIIAAGSPRKLIDRHCEGVTVTLPGYDADFPEDDFPLRFNRMDEAVEIYAKDVKMCLQALMDFNLDIQDMTVRAPNLEDVFLKLTGKQLRA